MLALLVIALVAPPASAPRPAVLNNAHSHNDYAQARPLLDALDQGFCSFEADVFLTTDGRLLVGHTVFDLRDGRTLEKLYLAPLRERVRQNGGRVYKNGPPVNLLIDLKTSGPATYAAVHELLATYVEMLTEVNEGLVTERAVRVVISGNCPRKEIAGQKRRYAAIDGRAGDLTLTAPTHLIPLVSVSWKSQFTWKGHGEMPATERQKLKAMAEQAHKEGRGLRFWATPDTVDCWREQRAAGVDWINTDRLKELREFLKRQARP